MTLPQNNKYSELVRYLEAQLPKKKDPSKKAKDEISTLTKDLIRGSFEDIHSDVTFVAPEITSKGFSVLRFESLMRAKLVDEHKRIQTYDRPYISVTELISCLRQKFYVRMKYKIDVKQQFSFAYLYLINQVGNCVHSIVQQLYDHTETEKTVVSEKYKVKGRVDGIRDNFLLEYKTIDEQKFHEKYLQEHYHQGLIYAYILNSEYNYKIDTITIVYFIRTLKRVVPFDLPTNDTLAKKFLQRSLILQECLSKNQVPEPVGADKTQCQYCSYKEYCKKDSTPMELPYMKKKEKKSKTAFLL